jgi:hypothetical protein
LILVANKHAQQNGIPILGSDLMKLICSLCLLGSDPSIIEPDVLDKDRVQYGEINTLLETASGRKAIWNKELKRRLEELAKKHGRFGWNVGREITMNPHYRKPHMAIRWTGEGRKIPRLVKVHGSIIHRDIVRKIPMGYEDLI